MSVTIELDLPDALVREAKANGLLESAPIGDLLATELRRRKAAAELKSVLDGVRAQPGESMSEEEIAAEVKAVRSAGRASPLSSEPRGAPRSWCWSPGCRRP